jgi:hypothetical protein
MISKGGLKRSANRFVFALAGLANKSAEGDPVEDLLGTNDHCLICYSHHLAFIFVTIRVDSAKKITDRSSS